MINKSIFKAYDVRGIYPTDVNEESITAIGKACLKLFPDGEIIIAHDARHGSPELSSTLIETIETEATAQGRSVTVRDVGLSTTPMFYFLVNYFKAVGGCMITASHNPKEYNGVKIVKAGAVTVSGTEVATLI